MDFRVLIDALIFILIRSFPTVFYAVGILAHLIATNL